MNKVSASIKSDNLQYAADNIKECLSSCTSFKEVQQLLSQCSHYVYNNKDSLTQQRVSCIARICVLCCEKIQTAAFSIDPVLHVKLIFYVVYAAVKENITRETLTLAEEISSTLDRCDPEKGDLCPLLKQLYTNLWNASIQQPLSCKESAQLQSLSLKFLSLSGRSLQDVCDMASKALVSLSTAKDASTTLFFLTSVFKIVRASLKRRVPFQPETVYLISYLLNELLRCLLDLSKEEAFRKLSSLLLEDLELSSDSAIATKNAVKSFMTSVGVFNAAALFSSRRKLGDLDLALRALKDAPQDPTSSSIQVQGLLSVMEVLQKSQISSSELIELDVAIPTLKMCISLARNLHTPKLKLKVLDALSNYLMAASSHMEKTADKETLLMKLRQLSSSWREIVRCQLTGSDSFHLHNVGIHFCNLGVFGYKLQKYELASSYFDPGVSLLVEYAKNPLPDHKESAIKHLIVKKAGLLKDSLRYGGFYLESVKKTIQFASCDVFPKSEIISSWIKCKRDSYTSKNKSIKSFTIKDVFDQIQLEGDAQNLAFDESFLLEEISGLKQLGSDSLEDQMTCARLLSASESVIRRTEGRLHLARIFWLRPDFCDKDESALKSCLSAVELLQEASIEGKSAEPSLLSELKALAHFWAYLCHLQIVEETAKEEIEGKKDPPDEPSPTGQDRLGEEEQPNDVCNIRTSTTVATFAAQRETLVHLDKSLQFWKGVCETQSLTRPEVACDTLLSTAYIYKLAGLTVKVQECILLLLSVAKLHKLNVYWVHGISELLLLMPELIPEEVALEARTELSSSSKDASSNLCVQHYALTSLAYYYLRNGMYSKGVSLIQECLSSPIMEKRNLFSTEVQILTLFVASCYATLPPKAFGGHKPEGMEHPVFLCLYATRKAIGLLSFSTEVMLDRTCWHHQIHWLHHEACLWLGRLCHLAAMPRYARAYLKQSLSVVEMLALPLRTAEVMCQFAEVDLLCDQYDDCRVKVDTLNGLLNVHGSPTREIPTERKQKKRPPQVSKKTKEDPRPPRGKKAPQPAITIYEDFCEEEIRESASSADYCLTPPPKDFGGYFIGQEERIGVLAFPNQGGALSPSLPHRERAYTTNRTSCPHRVVDCDICSAPSLQVISLVLPLLMASVHSYRKDAAGADRCFEQAQKTLHQIQSQSVELTARLSDQMNRLGPFGASFSETREDVKDLFYASRIAHGRLLLLFCSSELCCKRRLWEDARVASLAALGTIAKLHHCLLDQNSTMVLRVLLQAHSIDRVLTSQRSQDTAKLALSPIPANRGDKPSSAKAQTPLRRQAVSSPAGICMPGAPRKTRAAISNFKIFSDHETEVGASTKKFFTSKASPTTSAAKPKACSVQTRTRTLRSASASKLSQKKS